MRLPGAALLITIGLVLLWLATTGKIDKLGAAWDWVRDNTPSPESGPTGLLVKPTSTADRVKAGILHTETFHMASMMDTLSGNLAYPGGLT